MVKATWTPKPPAERRVIWMAKDRRLFARRPADPAGAWVIEDHGTVVFDGSADECIRWLASAPVADTPRRFAAA